MPIGELIIIHAGEIAQAKLFTVSYSYILCIGFMYILITTHDPCLETEFNYELKSSPSKLQTLVLLLPATNIKLGPLT